MNMHKMHRLFKASSHRTFKQSRLSQNELQGTKLQLMFAAATICGAI